MVLVKFSRLNKLKLISMGRVVVRVLRVDRGGGEVSK